MVGCSGLITPSLDEMVARREGDGASRARPAAADRRRHDLAPAHGRADRARVRPTRRSTWSTPPAWSAWSRRCSTPSGRKRSTARTGTCRSACVPSTRSARRPRCCRSGSPLERRTPIAWDAADLAPAGFTGARSVEPYARGASALHRLDLLLRGVGAEGLVPADPGPPSLREQARELLADANELLDEIVGRRLDPGARRLRFLAGAQRGRRHRAWTTA